jgi:hypothetical protein
VSATVSAFPGPFWGEKGEYEQKLYVTKTSKDLSIGDWTNAFLIFTDIYCEKFPKALHGLLAYMTPSISISFRFS